MLLRSQQALLQCEFRLTGDQADSETVGLWGTGALSYRERKPGSVVTRGADSWPCDIPSSQGTPSPNAFTPTPRADRSPQGPQPREVCSAPITRNPRRPATEHPRAPAPLTSRACCACNSTGWPSRCSASFSERFNFNLLQGCVSPHKFNSNNSLNIKTAAYTQSLRELITPTFLENAFCSQKFARTNFN